MIKKVVLIFSVLTFISWVNVSPLFSKMYDVGNDINNDAVEAKVIWHWENRFNREEVHKIKSWLTSVYSFTEITLGSYPFDIHFYIHRSDGAKEPVPWAHTTRDDIQGVHFHINSDFELDEFLEDWTAPHEISHLSIPFVGSKNTWFSEGYASYMQVQIMQAQGVYTSQEAQEKYQIKFEKCKPSYQSNDPMVKVVDSLKRSWNYPALYWGGASFFWKLDRDLKKNKGISLLDVIQHYEDCCRVNDSNPKDICKVFDGISNTNLATNLLIQYQTVPAIEIFEEF